MDDSTARFWNNYISETNTCNVPNHAQRWYVKHVEAYIKAHPGHRLADTEPDEVTKYLEKIGRKPEFPDWRLRQVTDALRILFIAIIKPDWAAKELRWQYLFPSVKLSADPRTGKVMRHHIHENNLQKSIKKAAELVGKINGLLIEDQPLLPSKLLLVSQPE